LVGDLLRHAHGEQAGRQALRGPQGDRQDRSTCATAPCATSRSNTSQCRPCTS
jgi:hypothetical protein